MNTSNHRKKIALIVTCSLVVKNFLVPHLRALSSLYDVSVILDNDDPEFFSSLGLPIRIIDVPIERKIRLGRDVLALGALYRVFRREKFDLVHTLAPKAGLLGILAAWLARVPVRIHTFQGEVWANKQGFMRWLLRTLDKVMARTATHLTVVSESERRHLIAEGIIGANDSSVLLKGSIGGVDLQRFDPIPAQRSKVRGELGVRDQDVLFMYVGRLTKDKGLLELAEAFQRLSNESANVQLAMVGPDEDHIREALAETERMQGGRLCFLPYTRNPEKVMVAADVLVLPSHREGFGVVIIEAAALGIPAIGSDIYGITDALERDKTGLLFERGNVADLYRVMKQLVDDVPMRLRMGQDARSRVLKYFDQKMVIQAFLDYYAERLGGRHG